MELIDLGKLQHAERRRWRSGGEWDERATKIALGELQDGRWYVERYKLGGEHRVVAYAGRHAEHYAQGTARRWMRTVGGSWIEASEKP